MVANVVQLQELRPTKNPPKKPINFMQPLVKEVNTMHFKIPCIVETWFFFASQNFKKGELTALHRWHSTFLAKKILSLMQKYINHADLKFGFNVGSNKMTWGRKSFLRSSYAPTVPEAITHSTELITGKRCLHKVEGHLRFSFKLLKATQQQPLYWHQKRHFYVCRWIQKHSRSNVCTRPLHSNITLLTN